MEIHELVALGGLLHDVGKPVERAGLYSGDHSDQGAAFLRDLWKNTGKEEYRIFALFSEFHHRKKIRELEIRRRIKEIPLERVGLSEEDIFNALWIVYEADNLSSSEREESKPERIRPLHSIFNPKMAFQPSPLDFKEKLVMPSEVTRVRAEKYSEIVRELWNDLQKAELRIDRLLPILEKHFTLVSSVTSEGNAISLYDHMRMTSAIALAMLRAGCTGKDARSGLCRKEKRFMLIEGDFSGIQDFIYNVSGKGALKYLRARSSYLEILNWDVVLEILSRLGLTRANVIFNAGGHFLIIAQNTPEALRELESIRKHVVKWLYQEFDGSLYLAIEWEPISGEELGKKEGENLFEKARYRLKRKLAVRKLRRFSEIKGLFDTLSPKRMNECEICGKETPEEDLENFILNPETKACKICNELAQLGKELPKLKGFVLSKEAHPREVITRGSFRYVSPYFEKAILGGEFLLLKNTLEPPELPETIEFVPYFVADYYKKGKEGIATFEELAEKSTGTDRVGVLKGDVDRLGNFFHSMDSPSKLSNFFTKAYPEVMVVAMYR